MQHRAVAFSVRPVARRGVSRSQIQRWREACWRFLLRCSSLVGGIYNRCDPGLLTSGKARQEFVHARYAVKCRQSPCISGRAKRVLALETQEQNGALNDSQTGVDVPSVAGSPEDRLDSWKKIASHLRRDVRTVQRWERSEGMPVHRHLHHRGGSVYAFRLELNAWWESRRVRLESGDTGAHQELAESPDGHAAADTTRGLTLQRLALIGLAAVLLAGSLVWWAARSDYFWHDPLANARFTRLPDLGTEHSAAISRDGKLVAIVAERDGQNDAWVSDGNFDTYRNLTHGALRGLNVVNTGDSFPRFFGGCLPAGRLDASFRRLADHGCEPSRHSDGWRAAAPVCGRSCGV